MRVTDGLREERGAVAVMVALSLVVLLGMLALVMDLGRAIGVRREMVNAADAAALAAAQACAMGEGSALATSAANDTAALNVPTATLVSIAIDPACDGAATEAGPKTVTVTYRQDVDYFVAPILGFDGGTVTTQATAIWSVPGIVPITVNAVPLANCPEPVGNEEPATCTVDYPKDELENPRWGILDLGYWNREDVASCPVPNSEVVDIIQGGGVPKDALDPWPDPTIPVGVYDCLDNGAQFASWDELVGGTWWFPVIDVANSKGVVEGPARLKNDPRWRGGCTGADIPELQSLGGDCRITTAYVVDFVPMKVHDVRIAPGTGGTIQMTMSRVPQRSSTGMDIRLVE